MDAAGPLGRRASEGKTLGSSALSVRALHSHLENKQEGLPVISMATVQPSDSGTRALPLCTLMQPMGVALHHVIFRD